MGKRVTLLPAGSQFVVEGQETVLEAAIRSGVALPYACSNGNCGQCKARIIEGEVQRARHQDYVFSLADRQQGFVLLCANSAISDLVLEVPDVDGAEEITEQKFRVKVRKLERISDQLLILHTRMPRGERMRFLAGQYATLSIPRIGDYDYSLASCPCDEKRLEFHIRYVGHEPVSDYLFNTLRVGERLALIGPKGRFVLHEDSLRPMIMIAFDTGFAAIKSLLEHATAQEKEREIYLYWISCGSEGQYLDNLCRSWQDALDEFHYIPLSISESHQEIMAQQAKGCEITKQKLLRVVDQHSDLSGFDVYIAAPEPFLESAQKIFLKFGLDPARLRAETVHGNQNVSCLVG
ncbi:MAG: 2Fe-2S iron-sulfur cluster binding domain-containing protein [Gammaproteobacteria bacterium]|nr:2Fe-2S iron-sulfur cluster binding domain-containing protein [Gammaproteobacteria bacterium]